jgi:hypothetical protein
MKNRTQISYAIIILGILIILSISIWFVINFSQKENSLQPTFNFNITSEEFYTETLLNNQSVDFAGKLSEVTKWQYSGPFNYSLFNEQIPIVGDISKIEELDKDLLTDYSNNVVIFGHFDNITFPWPVNNSINASMENRTFRVFNLKSIQIFNLSSIQKPSEIIEGDNVIIVLTIQNPFNTSLSLNISIPYLFNLNLIEGNVNIYETFNKGETKTFKWRFKSKGYQNKFKLKVFGRNKNHILWINEYYKIDIKRIPKLGLFLEQTLINHSGDLEGPINIEIILKNICLVNATNITVWMDIPKNITATKKIWHFNLLESGEEVVLYSEILLRENMDVAYIKIFASEETGSRAEEILIIE